MIAVHRVNGNGRAEAVHHFLQSIQLAKQAHRCSLAGEHIEHFCGIVRRIKPALIRTDLFHRSCLLAQWCNTAHTIQAQVHQIVIFFVITNQIVVIVLPDQRIGRHGKDLLPKGLFILGIHCPALIGELHLTAVTDGLVQIIYNVIDLFVRTFVLALAIHLAHQAFRLAGGEQTLQLLHQLLRLFRRNKPGGLHRVHQHTHLCQLKSTTGHVKAPAGIVCAAHIKAHLLERFNVRINGFTLAPNAIVVL